MEESGNGCESSLSRLSYRSYNHDNRFSKLLQVKEKSARYFFFFLKYSFLLVNNKTKEIIQGATAYIGSLYQKFESKVHSFVFYQFQITTYLLKRNPYNMKILSSVSVALKQTAV